MAGQADYVETVRIVIDQTQFTQSLRTAEKNYKDMLARLKALQNVSVKISATNDATKSVTALQSQLKTLTSGTHTAKVAVSGNAAKSLTSIQNQIKGLARAVTIPLHVAGAVGGAVTSMAGLAVEGGLTAGLAASAKGAIDYGKELNQVRNNTTLTGEETALLGRNVNEMAQKFGLATPGLMDSARQIMDLTQNAESMNGILAIASETAASTGASVADTGRLLAGVMHQYGLDMSTAATAQQRLTDVQANATQTMGVLHLAAALGNLTMEQFSAESGTAIALGSSLGISLEQVAGGLATLTRNGFDAAVAQTQMRGLMSGIIKPASDTEKLLGQLSKTTGVDLVHAFSAAGVAELGIPGVLDKVNQASKALNLTKEEQVQLWTHLIPNIRGELAGILLSGKASADYRDILATLSDKQKTGTFVAQAWANTQEQPATKLQQLEQRVAAVGRTIGAFLVPWVMKAVDWFEQWAPWAIAAAAALGVKLLPYVKDVAAWLGNLWSAGMQALDWIGKFLTWVLAGVNWLRQHNDALGAVAIGASILGTAFAILEVRAIAASIATAGLTVKQWLLNAAILANPISLMVMALVGLGVAFAWVYTHSKTFRKNTAWAIDFVGTSFSNLGTLVSTNGDLIKNVLLVAAGPIGWFALIWKLNLGNIQGLLGNFGSFVVGLFNVVTTWISQNGDIIRNILLALGGPLVWLAAAWQTNFFGIRDTVNNVVTWIGTKLNEFFEFIMDIGVKVGVVDKDWRTSWQGMKTSASDALAATSATVGQHTAAIGAKISVLGSTARGVGGAFNEFGIDAINSVKTISGEVQASGTGLPDITVPSVMPGAGDIAAIQAKLAALNASAASGGSVDINAQLAALGLTPPNATAVAHVWKPVGSSTADGIVDGMAASQEDVARGSKLLADITAQSARDALGTVALSSVRSHWDGHRRRSSEGLARRRKSSDRRGWRSRRTHSQHHA
jgi:TP901 family phage tail tape measure protein